MTAREILDFIDTGNLAASSPNEQTIVMALAQYAGHPQSWPAEEVYQEGLTRMLGQPEFTRLGDDHERAERIRKIVEALEQNALVSLVNAQTPPHEGVQVVIGGETAYQDLRDVSIVLGRYGLPGQEGGLLGVVGPTRMQYSRAVAMVRYMTQIMNELLLEYYGGPSPATGEDP